MILPKNEKRQFKTGILNNEIKYCLINDDTVNQSSVCISVGVGSLMDPLDNQGLAHFLEHMLFLGNNKYKKENFFDAHLKSFNGYSNAYTDTFETVYYFTCMNSGLEIALDCFSHFFIDPLFDKDSVSREINAINSEHQKNINSEYWRFKQIIFNLSKKDAGINKFATGSFNTFSSNVREVMIKFYNNYYTSNNLTITIISNEKINKLEKYIKFFEKIPFKKHKKIQINKPFYEKKTFKYQIIPLTDINKIIIVTEIDLPIFHWKDSFQYIISNLFNDKNKKSLHYYLIKKNLISSINSYVIDEGFILIEFNLININDIYKVINYYHNYLIYLQNMSSQKWLEIYNLNINENKLLFNYSSKKDTIDLIIEISNNLHYYPIKYFYVGDNLIIEKNFDIVYKKIKKTLLSLSNPNILFISQNKLSKNINSLIESNYKIEYFPIIYKNKFKNKNINFDIISKSPYFDDKPTILNLKDMKKPILLDSKIWYQSVKQFNEPLVYSIIQFYDNKLNILEHYMKIAIQLKIINIYIDYYFSLEKRIGYNIYLKIGNNNCIYLYISGLNNKYNFFVKKFYEMLDNLKIDEFIFNSVIVKLKDSYKLFLKKNPWKFLDYLESLDNNFISFSINQRAQYLEKIKFNHIKKINFYKELPCQIFITGNISNDIILKDLLNQNLHMKILLLNKLIKSNNWIHPNKNEKENCINVKFNIGKFNPDNNILLLIIKTIMEQQFYYELRTKQQCGYLVSCYIDKKGNYYYLSQKIQSTLSTKKLLEKILIFNKNFSIKNIDLDQWKKTIKNILLEKNENTYQVFSEFLHEILTQKYLFNRKDLLLSKLELVTKEKLDIFYKKYILNNKPIILELN